MTTEIDKLVSSYGMTRRGLLQGAAAAGAITIGPFNPRTALAAGELNVLAWEGFDQGPALADWRRKNGITVNSGTITTQDDVHAKLIGSSPIPLDVTQYNQSYGRFYADELGIVRPLDVAKLPNYDKGDIIPEFYQGSYWYWNGIQWGIPLCWGMNTLVYNPAKMAAPTSYTDLLDPKLKGRITITDEQTGTWLVFARLGGYGEKYPNLTKEELSDAFEKMKPYREQCATMAPTVGDVVSLLVSGEIDAVLSSAHFLPNDTAKQGVKTAYVVPKEGAVLWCDAYFIPKAAKHVELAHEFINLALTPEAQARLAADMAVAIVNKNAIALMDDNTKAMFDYSDLKSLFAASRFEDVPPRQSEQYATYDDWLNAYNEFKSGL